MADFSARAGDLIDGSGYLDLVRLGPSMARTSGRPEISISLIDGPVALDHPDLAAENRRADAERIRYGARRPPYSTPSMCRRAG